MLKIVKLKMRELSLHILDIVQNSIKAEADLIIIDIEADFTADRLSVTVTDDGMGMSKELLEKVTDPFTTTRKTRNVGMGLPLFKMAAEASGGEFDISSKEGMGTVVKASFGISSIDRVPLGELEETMGILLMGSPDRDFIMNYQIRTQSGLKEFNFDTREIKEELDDIPIDEYEIISSIKTYIKENIKETNGGLVL
ncbi:MAG: ATP-binding protein [Clostridia bacterium]|nr:ATP-binding protein [Clostridia bacterium]